MKYGSTVNVIACPYCDQPAHYRGIASSNTFGCSAWTDGFCFYPMASNSSSFNICSACNDVFAISDGEKIGILSTNDFVDESQEVPPSVWKKSKPIAEPSDTDMYRSLQKNLFKMEKDARIIAWWKSNDKFRFLPDDLLDKEVLKDTERQNNIDILIGKMNSDGASESILKADLFRQSRMFEESIEEVYLINDSDLLAGAARIDSLAKKNDYMVRQLNS